MLRRQLQLRPPHDMDAHAVLLPTGSSFPIFPVSIPAASSSAVAAPFAAIATFAAEAASFTAVAPICTIAPVCAGLV